MPSGRFLRDLEKVVGPHGWRCVRMTNHLIWRGPDGQQVVTASSPSDQRQAFRNALRDFKTHGCPL